MDGIENGEISLASFTRLITEISENKSNKLLPPKEAQIILYNTALVRNLIRGKREFNISNYSPMPIENELEKVEYFYLSLVLNEIISNTKKGIYSVDTLGLLWDDFFLVHKFEGELLHACNDDKLAIIAKNALAEVFVKILKVELAKKMSETRRDQLMLGLSAVHSSYNFSDSTAKKLAVLMKKYDPNNKYGHK
jgi:hypothetical protein